MTTFQDLFRQHRTASASFACLENVMSDLLDVTLEGNAAAWIGEIQRAMSGWRRFLTSVKPPRPGPRLQRDIERDREGQMVRTVESHLPGSWLDSLPDEFDEISEQLVRSNRDMQRCLEMLIRSIRTPDGRHYYKEKIAS